MTLKFVVVGSGRSGTAYAAALLTHLGLPCGHEAVLGKPNPRHDLLGDASFLAVPWLRTFHGLVFHQVRDPLTVLRSMISTGFFERPDQYAPVLQLIQSALPEIQERPDALTKAMYFIARWNQLCEERARLRWQVETLDAGTLHHVSVLLNEEKSIKDCEAALRAVPRDVNRLESKGLPRRQFGWTDIPDGREKSELQDLTVRYGYGVDG